MSAKNLMVKALAGTGKTTTMVWSVGTVPRGVVLSDEQAAIRKWVSKIHRKTTRFVAFNKIIAEELGRRIPKDCEASTCHSMGLSIIKTVTKGQRLVVDQYKYSKIFYDCYCMGRSDEVIAAQKPINEQLVQIINLARSTLTGVREGFTLVLHVNEVAKICEMYDIELEVSFFEATEKINNVLKIACNFADNAIATRVIDFVDMIWMPVFYNLPVQPVDLLIVDECQDLNKAQQELVLRCGHHLVVVGDVHQAIYGFSGADRNSFLRLEQRLSESGGVDLLTLYQTRRCGKAIVREANSLVPELVAHETNPEGKVGKHQAKSLIEKLDACHRSKRTTMVVCRTNAPLLALAFRLIANGVRTKVQGREIGATLANFIKKFKESDVGEMLAKLELYEMTEEKKLLLAPWGSEEKILNLHDKCECVRILCDGEQSVDVVVQKIQSMFDDTKTETGMILLSSAHRSKGLEAKTVFIYRPDLLPHPRIVEGSFGAQEYNLKYVAITRAIEELYYVQPEKSEKEPAPIEVEVGDQGLVHAKQLVSDSANLLVADYDPV